MHAAINCLSARRSSSNLIYLANLLPALGRYRKDHAFTVILSSGQQQLRLQVPTGFGIYIIREPCFGVAQRLAWEQFFLPVILRKIGANVLFSPGNTTSLLTSRPVVLVCQNINPFSRLRLPWSPRERFRNLVNRYLGTWSAKKADVVVFVSEASRRIMLRRLGIDPAKTMVVYHGVPAEDVVELPVSEEVDCPYVLTVSVVYPHKNLVRLVRAFGRLVREGYAGRLVIAGSILSNKYLRSVRQEIERFGLDDWVLLLGTVAHDHAIRLCAAADLVVMPSLEETFGLPCVEAMSRGTPVVAADFARTESGDELFIPFREICGDAAEYFDPLDEVDMYRAMSRALQPERARFLGAAGPKRAAEYSWDAAAKSLIGAFERAWRGWRCSNRAGGRGGYGRG